jgi:glutaminase
MRAVRGTRSAVDSPLPDYLTEALAHVAPDTSGAPAQYTPELTTADPERLAAVFSTVDGQVYGAGDTDVELTIQSICKPFTYALALADRGFDAVLAKVGVEPSRRRSTSCRWNARDVRSTP